MVCVRTPSQAEDRFVWAMGCEIWAEDLAEGCNLINPMVVWVSPHYGWEILFQRAEGKQNADGSRFLISGD
jgi:hypothetical protein